MRNILSAGHLSGHSRLTADLNRMSGLVIILKGYTRLLRLKIKRYG